MAKPDAPARKAKKLPAGFKDEAAFIKDAREKFQEAVDFDRENREAGIEDLKFFAGEQWDADAKAARAGRPCLTINSLPQYVAQVTGDIRINRPAIKVRPAEDADKDLADIREGLIRSIERENDAPGVYAETGQAQVACGIGNFRVGLKYATYDGFDRDIAISTIPNPFSVVWDPMSTERTGRDARYCFVDDQIPRKEFEAKYKDEIGGGLEVPQTDVNGWHEADTVRVCEYWIVTDTPVELALLQSGAVCEVDKVPKGEAPVRTRKSSKRTACMYLITGKGILDGPYEMPIDRVPIIRVPGWIVNIGDKRVRFGLVRFAKDSVRLKNYWRSVSAEMLALAPKAQWLATMQAIGEDNEDDFRTNAKSGDPLLLWTGQGVAPERVTPPPIPTAILQEAALNAQDIKDVTGLHDASLGAKSNETSGKAINARQREGDVAAYIYHDNLQAGIREGGRVVDQYIPVVYDTARTIRTVGEDDSTKVLRINDPANPDSVDINKGKYDIVIETGPSYSTRRVEAAESIIEFSRANPVVMQVAGDLVAKAMDWPMADQIGERLKKAIPPQLLEGEEGQEPPKPDPAAEAAQEMQGKMGDAALRKAIAEADKAEAEAFEAKLDYKIKALSTGVNIENGILPGSDGQGIMPPVGPQGSPQPGGAPVPQPQPMQPPAAPPGPGAPPFGPAGSLPPPDLAA